MASFKIGIISINSKSSITIINKELLNMFGYNEGDLINQPVDILFDNDSYKFLQDSMDGNDEIDSSLIKQSHDLIGIRRNKTSIPVEVSFMKKKYKQTYITILILRAVEKSKKSIAGLKHLAYYDQLTKIPNRTLFFDRAKMSIRQARRDNQKLAILYIDIDEFKSINDTLGHSGGDILLKEIAQRLRTCIRDSDTVSRVGGDEFAILMLKISQTEDVSLLVKRIIECNKTPIRINQANIVLKTSIGISIFPADGKNIEELLHNADTAMYSSKNKGKNQAIFYTSSMKVYEK